MASTYTGLGTELMTTGENAGNWGTKTNVNLQIIEQIAGGYVEQAISSTTTTLSVSDGSTGATLGHRVIKFTGTLSGNSTVTVPLDVQQMYILVNGTSGTYTLTFKYVSGSGSTVAFGTTDKGTKIVYAAADHASNPNMVDTGISTNTLTGVTGDITIDSPADIIFDADGADFKFKDGGTEVLRISNSSSDVIIKPTVDAKDIIFQQYDATEVARIEDGVQFNVSATTASSSATTGALITGGGLGVAADAYVGDDVYLISDSAILGFGADKDTTLTHTDGTGLTLNSTNKLCFYDTALYIHSSTDGQLDLVADTEIQIAATTIDINGAVALNGAITGATNITLSGELDAATLDISGNADIDGTTNLDAVDIDGAVQVDATITVGADDQGYDVKFFGDTASAYMLWDTSADDLVLAGAAGIDLAGDIDVDGTANLDAVDIDGAVQIDNTVTVGVDDTGYDVKFFGDTASAYMLWDTSADDLILGGAAGLIVPDGQFTLGSTAVSATAAEINLIDGGTARGTTAVADGDGLLVNDAGTMRMTNVTTLKTYFQSGVGVAADDISAGDAAVTIGNGSTSADVTLDSGDDVVIDAAGGNVEFKDAGTLQLSLDMDGTAGVQIIKLGVDSDDLVFQQYDGNEVMRINDNRKVCFYDDGGEHISSDGTDFTFASGNDINLTATTDINVPSGVGMTFGDDGEKIEGDGTDLTIASSAKLNLTATSDVHIPNNVGIIFGGDSEKIEGDGTDLTISANNLTIDCAADLVLDAGGNDFNFKAGGTEIMRFTNSSSDVIIKPIVDAKDIIIQQRDGNELVNFNDGGYSTFTRAAYFPEATISDGATPAWDVSTESCAKITIAGNRTIGAPSNGVAGQFISLLIIQDGTGSRTMTWNAVYEFASDTAPTLTTTADKADLFVFRYHNSKWLEVGRTLALTVS